MKIVKKLLLVLLLSQLLVGSVLAAEVRTVHLVLDGLFCASCKYAVKVALTDLEGVNRADVSYEQRRATVLYDPEKVTTQQLIDVVKKSGFGAELQAGEE